MLGANDLETHVRYLNSTRTMKRRWRAKFTLGLAKAYSFHLSPTMGERCLLINEILCISKIFLSHNDYRQCLVHCRHIWKLDLSTYVNNCEKSGILNSFFASCCFSPIPSQKSQSFPLNLRVIKSWKPLRILQTIA